ncbi:MAG TPA: DUF1259 domain-containing protein [Acidocella sp.]|nr:DUF1259 domain-containing protein [Acidocella sp.]
MTQSLPLQVAALSRRRAVLLGSGLAAASFAAPAFADNDGDKDGSGGSRASSLPVDHMNQILGAKGQREKKVVGYSFVRSDLHGSLPGGIQVLPEALLAGDVYFQAIGNNRAIVNADFCLAPDETNKFIDALVSNGLTLQAFHQHLFDLSPMAWFQHFRGEGEPIALATAVANAIKVTATPLPQPSPPPSSATPLPTDRLKKILGGDSHVHGHGVVEVDVKRAEHFTLNDQHISRGLNIATNIYFQPLDHAGHQALVIPDFGMLAKEVDPVMRKMRGQGWTVGCLYNQETAEHPQLFWSHMWKTGAPETLAQEIRHGLELCNMRFSA